MASKELLSAPDLVVGREYGKVEGGGRRIVATIYSSKSLGLDEREALAAVEKNEEQGLGVTHRGSAKASGAAKAAESKD
jgi:hypothetical protein